MPPYAYGAVPGGRYEGVGGLGGACQAGDCIVMRLPIALQLRLIWRMAVHLQSSYPVRCMQSEEGAFVQSRPDSMLPQCAM